MSESQGESSQKFKYTKDERVDISKSLEKYFCEECLLDFETSWKHSSNETFEAHIEKEVIHTIESLAEDILLPQLDKPLAKKRSLSDIDKLTKHAKELLNFLEAGGTAPEGYWCYYSTIPGISFQPGGLNLSIISDLRAIIQNQGKIKENIAASFEHGYDNFNDPTSEEYLGNLLDRWEYWTGKKPGKSKVGGPAARFVVCVYNPLKYSLKKFQSLNLEEKIQAFLTKRRRVAGSTITFQKSSSSRGIRITKKRNSYPKNKCGLCLSV